MPDLLPTLTQKDFLRKEKYLKRFPTNSYAKKMLYFKEVYLFIYSLT